MLLYEIFEVAHERSMFTFLILIFAYLAIIHVNLYHFSLNTGGLPSGTHSPRVSNDSIPRACSVLTVPFILHLFDFELFLVRQVLLLSAVSL